MQPVGHPDQTLKRVHNAFSIQSKGEFTYTIYDLLHPCWKEEKELLWSSKQWIGEGSIS